MAENVDEHKEAKPKKADVPPPFDCAACGDTKTVTLRLMGADSEIYRQVPCPECGPGIRLSDPAQIVTQEDLRKLASLVLMALALAALAVLLSSKREPRVSPFAQAVKEVKETVESE